MNDIEQRVKKVIAEQLSINEADIKNESVQQAIDYIQANAK